MKEQKKAAAISYDPAKDQAPQLVAAGRGLIAEKILEVARAFDIPVREDRNLVQILEALEIDVDIPEELYRVVAEVLVYIYKMDIAYGDKEVSGTTK